MGLIDNLVQAGFKPEASTDGEFKPLKGTYKTEVSVLRSEIDTKNNNAKFYQLNLKPSETLDGDGFTDKFEFKKRFYVDGDKAAENLKKMLNLLFTAGIELDMTSDAAMEESFINAIGKTVYIRSWGWLPEGKDQAQQMFSAIKEKVAGKTKKSNPVPF